MDISVYRKISFILFAIIFVFICLFAIRSCSDNNQNNEILDYYLNQSKHESDSIIASKNAHISNLMRDIHSLNKQIKDAQLKIDSLERKKAQIQYVYINKLKEINEYDAKQLQEYWQNEFKK